MSYEHLVEKGQLHWDGLTRKSTSFLPLLGLQEQLQKLSLLLSNETKLIKSDGQIN